MSQFEYKVVPAPARGIKARGLRTPEDRLAGALSEAINAMAADGWDYLRAETLPCEERAGWLSGRVVTRHHTLLVFRRALPARSRPEEPPLRAPAMEPPGPEALRAIPSRAAAPVQRPAPPEIAAPARGPAPPRPVRRDD